MTLSVNNLFSQRVQIRRLTDSPAPRQFIVSDTLLRAEWDSLTNIPLGLTPGAILVGGSGGEISDTPINFLNGIIRAGNDVKLGGTLIENTEIDGGETYTMLFDSIGAFGVKSTSFFFPNISTIFDVTPLFVFAQSGSVDTVGQFVLGPIQSSFGQKYEYESANRSGFFARKNSTANFTASILARLPTGAENYVEWKAVSDTITGLELLARDSLVAAGFDVTGMSLIAKGPTGEIGYSFLTGTSSSIVASNGLSILPGITKDTVILGGTLTQFTEIFADGINPLTFNMSNGQLDNSFTTGRWRAHALTGVFNNEVIVDSVKFAQTIFNGSNLGIHEFRATNTFSLILDASEQSIFDMYKDSIILKSSGATNSLKFLLQPTHMTMTALGAVDIFKITDDGTAQLHNYGALNKEAADIGATLGNPVYLANDGRLLDISVADFANEIGAATNYWTLSGGDVYRATGQVGIGATDLSVDDKLNIVGIKNHILVANTIADSTSKFGRFATRHYANAEEAVSIFNTFNSSSGNSLNIGGGTSDQNAPSIVRFYLAPNNITLGGTSVLEIGISEAYFQYGTSRLRFRESTAIDGIMIGDEIENIVIATEGTGASQIPDGAFIMLEDSTERIGIGTILPLAKLHVNSSAAGTLLGVETETAGASYLSFWNSLSGTTVTDGLTVGVNGFDAIFNNREDGAIFLSTNGINRFLIERFGTARFHNYGLLNEEAADRGKTLGNPAYLATDGTLLDISVADFANEIAVATNYWTLTGGDVYRLTGNVGIGTASPGELLHIMAPTGIGETTVIKTQRVGGFGDTEFKQFYTATGPGVGMKFFNGGTETFRFTGVGGNNWVSFPNRMEVGQISTANPSYPFHVVGAEPATFILAAIEGTSTYAYLQFHHTLTGTSGSNDGMTVGMNGLNAFVINREAGNLTLSTSDAARILIEAGGDIGINTANAIAQLDVRTDVEGDIVGLWSQNVTRIYQFQSNASNDAVFKMHGSTAGNDKILLQAGGDSYFNGGDVGIGLTNPNELLHVQKNQNATTTFLIDNGDTGTVARVSLEAKMAGNVGFQVFATSSGYLPSGLFLPNRVIFDANGSNGLVFGSSHSGGLLQLYSGGFGATSVGIVLDTVQTVQFNYYGGLNKEAGDLSETLGNPVYLSTTGKLLDISVDDFAAEIGAATNYWTLTGSDIYRLSDVGVGSTTPGKVGATNTLTIENTARAQFELSTTAADAEGVEVGRISGWFDSNIASHDEIARIQFETDGGTANQRGGKIIFSTKANGSTTITELFTIRESGSIGFGTPSPQARFHIKYSTSGTLQALESTGTESYTSYWNNTTGTSGTDGLQVGMNSLESIVNNQEVGALSFGTSDLIRMTIDSVGDVSIGTTVPNLTNAGRALTIESATIPALEFSTTAADADGVTIGSIRPWFNANSTNHDEVARIDFLTDGITANQRGGEIQFKIKPNGSTSLITPMKIEQNGGITMGNGSTAIGSGVVFIENVDAARGVAALIVQHQPTAISSFGTSISALGGNQFNGTNTADGIAFSGTYATGGTNDVGIVFKANTPAGGPGSSIHDDGYGLYIEAQEGANVTTGWGIYQAGIVDSNYFAGAVEMNQSVLLSGRISPGALSANTDNWNPTNFHIVTYISMSASTPVNLTGLDAGTEGEMKVFYNSGNNAVTWVHQATSSAANQISHSGSANHTMNPHGVVMTRYDATSNKWIIISTTE